LQEVKASETARIISLAHKESERRKNVVLQKNIEPLFAELAAGRALLDELVQDVLVPADDSNDVRAEALNQVWERTVYQPLKAHMEQRMNHKVRKLHSQNARDVVVPCIV
jgi:hypothetical protein